MSKFAPDFTEDNSFESPTVKSGVQSLFLLAAALRPRLAELDHELGTVEVFLPYLAECAWKGVGRTPDPAKDLQTVWELFFADPAIKALPDRVGAILHEVRAQSLLPAGEKDAGAAELEAAHRQAHSFVNDVLKKNVKLSVATSSLVVAYDKEARIFCASTSEVLNKVRWIHQPVAHALYAALIPEIILAHEYLSHLAPKNPHLGNVITEEWLVVALMQSFQGEAGKPGQKKWKNTVWFLQRNAIMKHLDALLKADPEAQRKTAEPALESHIYGVYEFAFLLYGRSRAAFWKLTGLFLKARNDIDTKTIESLMKKMVAEQDSWLDFLEAGKWNKLKYLISR